MVYRSPSTLSASGRDCPRCATPLASQTVGPTTVERCPACQGLWIPAAEFNELILDLDRQEAVREAEPAQATCDEPVQYIKCPICRATMARTNFARRSGIFVDSCRKHGVWLDQGELRQLVDYLAAPKADEDPARAPRKTAPTKASPKIGQLLGPMPEPLPEAKASFLHRGPTDFWGALFEIIVRLVIGR
jgi:Zn-finger nucleic acid-binding protein